MIAKWFRTPEGASECISTILNAANDSRKNAESQIGHHELYFEDYNNELKRMITNRLRRYFNKMRTAKDGGDMSVKRYYNSPKNRTITFNPDSSDTRFYPITYRYEDLDDIRILGKVVVYTVNLR